MGKESKHYHWYFAGTTSCNGDSGGPLLIKEGTRGSEEGLLGPWYQTGIVSFGSSGCRSNKPAVYTKVSDHLDWIESVMEE